MILLVILLTFTMMRQIGGNPFRTVRARGPRVDPARTSSAKFHLDEPWYVQYANYVKDVFTFDLGPSLVLRNRT